MKIKVSQVRATLVKALTKSQIPLSKAKIIANDYLEGELQGKKSHGLMAFPSLLEKLPKKDKPIKVIKKSHSVIVFDAQGNLGAVVANQAIDWLQKTTQKEGLAMALIKNMTTWLRPGAVAQKLAEKDLVGIVVNNGGRPMVAAPGGYEPVIGTNPIGIGIPTAKENIVADMATSIHAWGEVRKAEVSGEPLPKNAYYDSKGKIAVKAKDAYAALPVGDYKGFTLGLLIEILTCSLMGKDMGKTQMKGDYRMSTRGGVIIAINPGMTTSIASFKKKNSQLVREIETSKKLKGIKKIRVPGELAAKTKSQVLHRGYLEVPAGLWSKLTV